jgi:hypothetical protein
MERHRLFRLDASLTLMGFEVDDWAVLLGSWTVLLQVLGVFLSARPRLVLATALAGFAFLAYRRVKDRVPGKFGRHLLGYVVEPDDYRVVPDEVNIPYVIPVRQGEAAASPSTGQAPGRRERWQSG